MFWHDRGGREDDAVFLVTENKEFRYADIFARADAVWKGRAPGVAAILCDRGIETIAAYLGALRQGIVPLLLDADLRDEALRRTIADHRPDYIFAPHPRDLAGYVPLERIGAGHLLEKSARDRIVPHPDLALLLPTSGSTGDSKCVRISRQALNACTLAICDYLAMNPARRCILALPLHYSYGLSVLNITIASRASLVLTGSSILDRAFWQLIEDKGVTDFSGVPFMYETLRRMKFTPGVLGALRCVTQAGGRLDPRLTRHFRELFGAAGIRYFTMYGQTEASPRISYLPPERAQEKEGSVGIPISCGEARIAETGAPRGEGELIYIGENVCMGYARKREDITLGDEFKGRLHTGDQVRIDDDGFIYVVGRRKRFIKLHGISVNLDHVESVLKSYDIACAVVGGDNRIAICYRDQTAEALSEIVARNFNFHPSTVRYAVIDEVPLNASGKPDYMALTERYL
jgi:acyl-CoA synthetase (AMP-forming)/AMP-acid ligase II